MSIDAEKLSKIQERARITRSVLAQLPLAEGDPKVLEAYKIVFEAAKKAACSSLEEEKAFEESFAS